MHDHNYVITPPSLKITAGPSFLLIGFDDDEVEKIVLLIEDQFSYGGLSIMYNNDTNGYDKDNVAWLVAAVGMATYTIVNVDKVCMDEMYALMSSRVDRNSSDSCEDIFWLKTTEKITPLSVMIGNHQRRQFGDDIEEVISHVKSVYG
jgi:hypothetical protein